MRGVILLERSRVSESDLFPYLESISKADVVDALVDDRDGLVDGLNVLMVGFAQTIVRLQEVEKEVFEEFEGERASLYDDFFVTPLVRELLRLVKNFQEIKAKEVELLSNALVEAYGIELVDEVVETVEEESEELDDDVLVSEMKEWLVDFGNAGEIHKPVLKKWAEDNWGKDESSRELFNELSKNVLGFELLK